MPARLWLRIDTARNVSVNIATLMLFGHLGSLTLLRDCADSVVDAAGSAKDAGCM